MLRQQVHNQRGFAHPGQTDKNTGFVFKLLMQLIKTFIADIAGPDNGIAQMLIFRFQPGNLLAVFLAQQIDFIEQNNGRGRQVFGGHQIAINQIGIRLRLQGGDNHNLIDIGGHGFELAAKAGFLQQGLSWFQCHNHPFSVTGLLPDDLVPTDQRPQILPGHAAKKLLLVIFYNQALAKIADNLAALFRAKSLTGKLLDFLLGVGFGLAAALLLNVGNAPLLLLGNSPLSQKG